MQELKGGENRMVKEIMEISSPKIYLDSNPEVMRQVVSVVKDSFQRELNYDDIYLHATSPDTLYLLMEEGNVIGMASYNRTRLSTSPALIVEGISLAQEVQGYGMFSEITDRAINGESIICLRTQSPRMYRALEKYCSDIFPGAKQMSETIRDIRDDLATHLECQCDKDGIVNGFYGGLFYGEEPKHKEASEFFSRLGIDLTKGDALLCVGVR